VEALLDGSNVLSVPDWMVSLRVIEDNSIVHKCPGALIDQKWVVTSALCVYGLTLNKAYLGSGDKTNGNAKYVANVINKYSNTQYTYLNRENDIALIEVTPSPVPLKTIRLASSSDTNNQNTLIVWSYATNGNKDDGALRESVQDVVDQSYCKDFYQFNSQNMYCMGRPYRTIDSDRDGDVDKDDIIINNGACESDDGGPLLGIGNQGVVLTGIMSNGFFRCDPDGETERMEPDTPESQMIGTKLYKYKTWIEQTAKITLQDSGGNSNVNYNPNNFDKYTTTVLTIGTSITTITQTKPTQTTNFFTATTPIINNNPKPPNLNPGLPTTTFNPNPTFTQGPPFGGPAGPTFTPNTPTTTTNGNNFPGFIPPNQPFGSTNNNQNTNSNTNSNTNANVNIDEFNYQPGSGASRYVCMYVYVYM